MYYTMKCSHGPTAVYAIKNVIYYGSGAMRATDFEGELIVNFTPYPNLPQSVMQIPSLAKHLRLPFKEILIPWPDMGTPYIMPEFWEALHKYTEENKFEHVCFHCQAGHGRTGTALSSMLIVNAGWEAAEAQDFVRTEYCKEAVESYSQVGYLRLLDKHFNDRSYEEELPNLQEEEMLPSSTLRSNVDTSGVEVEPESEVEEKEVVLYEGEDEENKIIFD